MEFNCDTRALAQTFNWRGTGRTEKIRTESHRRNISEKSFDAVARQVLMILWTDRGCVGGGKGRMERQGSPIFSRCRDPALLSLELAVNSNIQSQFRSNITKPIPFKEICPRCRSTMIPIKSECFPVMCPAGRKSSRHFLNPVLCIPRKISFRTYEHCRSKNISMKTSKKDTRPKAFRPIISLQCIERLTFEQPSQFEILLNGDEIYLLSTKPFLYLETALGPPRRVREGAWP